jgi:hypothetical protein
MAGRRQAVALAMTGNLCPIAELLTPAKQLAGMDPSRPRDLGSDRTWLQTISRNVR